MKDELSTVWEDLTAGADWTCLGRELLAGSSNPNIEEKDSNLDGSPPPGGGGGSASSSLDEGELKAAGGGCRGVYFDHIRHLWRANWPEETIVMDRDSKRPIEVRRCTRTKGFSAKKFGFQESKRMAVAHRKTMITSGVIRKYIYQEGGGAAAASVGTPASSGPLVPKKPLRDKKRRKMEKTMTPVATAAAAAAVNGRALTARASASPSTVASANSQSAAGSAATAPTGRDAAEQPSERVIGASAAPGAAGLDLMLCLDPQTSVSVTSVSNSNSSPMNSTVAYDFTFL